ncbi:MAG: hypothetical protein K1060chlam5_00896 [Candidatus Anoxychlamydiales bacterium]|nr:hypothetical protein [Candidatus Anoxychlamydiales bacterium]
MKIKYLCILLILLITTIKANETIEYPWYTGPLITYSAENLEKGLVNIQPYLHFRDTYGEFNKSWGYKSLPSTFTFKPTINLQFGLTKYLDVTFLMIGYYKEKSKEKAVEYGDTTVTFGIQLLRQEKNTYKPSIRLTLAETFPTGKYKNLNPNKLGIDASGSGSYETTFSLNLSKIAYFFENHPISFRLNLNYLLPSNAKVRGFNAYGGGFNTNGTVKPGHIIGIFGSFEFSMTQRWVLAMDILHTHGTKVTFKGNKGLSLNGLIASNSSSSSSQTSLAPAIEYNFNKNLGVLAGVHFVIQNKNATNFLSEVISVTYTF